MICAPKTAGERAPIMPRKIMLSMGADKPQLSNTRSARGRFVTVKTTQSVVSDAAKAAALAKFLWWIVHDGQQYSASLIYVKLPQNIVSADEQLLHTLNYQGQTLLS